MVRRTDSGWVLTEEGSAEAEGAPDRIREAAAEASRDVSRTYGALTALNLSNPPPAFNASYRSPAFEFLTRNPLPQPSPYDILRTSLKQNPSPTKMMLDHMAKTLPKFDFASTMCSLTESMRQSISVMQQAATQTMGSDIMRSLTRGFVSQLPDLTELYAKLERTRRGVRALEENEYGFSMHLWTDYFVMSLGETLAEVRPVDVTNRVLNFTRSAEYEEMLRESVAGSPVLRRRLKAIKEALDSHRRRHYYAAIATVLPIVEGVITDALVLRNIAEPDGDKFYLKEAGARKIGRDGKSVELRGLASKVERSGWRDDKLLRGAAELLLEKLAGERNGVLHGGDTRYGQPKRSAQLFLMLLILCTAIESFEAHEDAA